MGPSLVSWQQSGGAWCGEHSDGLADVPWLGQGRPKGDFWPFLVEISMETLGGFTENPMNMDHNWG